MSGSVEYVAEALKDKTIPQAYIQNKDLNELLKLLDEIDPIFYSAIENIRFRNIESELYTKITKT